MLSIKKYIICFEFLGLDFFGSQKQPDKRTVQNEIEKALCTLIKDKINIIISGRTDAKVSAKYQVAHFCTSETIENTDKFLYHLNCILPSDLKIFLLKEVKPDFHAQKDAKYKHYRYTIQNDHVASVFLKQCLFYPYAELDIERINQSLSHLIGHHDFSSFKSNSDNPYNDCHIYYAGAIKEEMNYHEKRQNFIFIDIIGNRFLYNMVRTIVGQILKIERNNLSPIVMKEVLLKKDRSAAASVVSPLGLSLEYVGYYDVNKYIENFIHKRKVHNENI